MRATSHEPRAAIFTCLIALLLAAAPAQADFKMMKSTPLPKTKFEEKPIVSSKQPALLEADQVDYDQPNDVVVATGHVVITQGDTVLMADQVIYDRGRDEVTATGHASMLEPSGNVYFADAMEMHDEMKSGIMEAFKARLIDDSVLVANRAKKIDENHTELFRAAYTPCKCLTDDGKPQDPLWALKADRAELDQEDQKIRYTNAYFNAGGLPILYTPYFSHPAPGADNQSGLLMPEFLRTTNLGFVYRQPVYYTIAPDRDITLTPIYTSLNGPVMAGEYRQMFDSGPLVIDGSITSAPNIDALGTPIPGHEIRGNIDGKGAFKLSDDYDWGFDVHRTTDDTYLRLYNFSNETLLTSRIYAEGFNTLGDSGRSYASIQGLAFQGLTGLDDPKVIPVVLPLTDVNWQSAPGIYHSRFTFDGDAMALYRQTGDQSRRLSGAGGWKLPYISEGGQVIEFDAKLRTDIYDVNDQPLTSGATFNGVTGREVPTVSFLWRYPFIDRLSSMSITMEPVVAFTASDGGGNPEKIPNEDSLFPEFTDTNLFSPNRFPGLDRVEDGGGVSYGVRGQAQISDKYVDWLLGQHYRLYDDTDFPFSDDPNSRFSDYVGKIGLNYQPVTLAYRFRFDHETLTANRSEVDAGLNLYPVNLSTSYLSLRNDPILATKEIITGSAVINLTQQWMWNVSDSRDILLKQTDAASTGITFKNECLAITGTVGKDYTRLQDIAPSLTFWFTVSLKNID